MSRPDLVAWTKAWAEKNQVSVRYLEETTSTNDIAKSDLSHTLFITRHQTKGRGQHGRQWLSFSGDNLLSSWRWESHSPFQPFSSLLWGVHILEALKQTWPALALSLKAPNDIYIEDKKLAGILIESLSQGDQHQFVLGLGLNVFSHPKEVSNSTHLSEHISVTQENWFDFLNHFHSLSKDVLNRCQKSQLSSQDQEKVLNALKGNPWLKSNVLQISGSGEIQTSDKTHPTPWFEASSLYKEISS